MFQLVGREKGMREVQDKEFSKKLVRCKFYLFLSYHFGNHLIAWPDLAIRQPGEYSD